MSIYQTYVPPTQSGGFLKIEDGKTVILRIASEPVIFQSEYKGNLTTRYAWVVYNMAEDAAQIFSQSARFFSNLAVYAKDDEYGDPTTYNIKVTRNGTDTNTTYTIVASPKKSSLTADQREAVKSVDIIKAIKAGPGVSNVFWLNDFAKGNTPKQETSGYEKAKAVANNLKNKQEEPAGIEFPVNDMDYSDEPIDLSEIPFN